tara:strand:+ start:161 stop:1921 length:1761 start_codon:yes stop_codon:yes gene_type:complete
MKSFEQFEYENTLVDESIVGTNVSQRFQKNARSNYRGNTSSAQYSSMMNQRKPTPSKKLPPQTKPFAGNEPTTEKVKVLGKSAPRQEPQSPKAPSIPTRAGRRSDGSKKSGIQATIDRNKERATEYASSKRGQRQLSAVGGAANAFRKYRPDGENAERGTGLGTNMRALAGRKNAVLDGGISAYKNKKKSQDPNYRPKSKVTGSGSEKETGSTGVGGVLGNLAKSALKKGLDIKDSEVKTSGGRRITVNDTDRYKPGQERRAAARKTAEDKYRESRKVRKQNNQETSKSNDDSTSSSAVRNFTKKSNPDNKTVEKQIKTASKDDDARKQVEKDSGKPVKGGAIERSSGGKVTTTGSASDEAKKNFKKLMGSSPNQPKLPSTDKKGGETDSPIVKGAISAAEKESKRRKKANAGADKLMAAMRKQGKKDDTTPENKAITVKATTVPKKKAGRPKGSTSGKRGRSATRASSGEKLRNTGDAIIKGLRDEKKKEVKEATNFIKAEQEAKAKGQKKTRSYAQMRQDKAKERAMKRNIRQQNESYSDWREEFLWEVDKKYPEKAKEIKPMTGKNTIIINPEDESAKYKRGY